ncbi:hypothetical protein Ddc_04641 [Ditylenchus destructor]|nr:hypothetical protein Ddc_04641 [Ditylenchus destructor]
MLEERILGECLMLFCPKDDTLPKDYPDELTSSEVSSYLSYLNDYAERLSTFTYHIHYVQNYPAYHTEVARIKNLENTRGPLIENKDLCAKFVKNVTDTRDALHLPFYQLRLYLQPDIFRMTSLDDLAAIMDTDKWKFFITKIREIMVQVFPDAATNEIDEMTKLMHDSFFRPLESSQEWKVYDKINSALLDIWTKTIKSVMPKRLHYICPENYIRCARMVDQGSKNCPRVWECSSCMKEMGNITTIFSPKIYHKDINPATIESINQVYPEFWQDYNGDHILRAYQVVREEKRKAPYIKGLKPPQLEETTESEPEYFPYLVEHEWGRPIGQVRDQEAMEPYLKHFRSLRKDQEWNHAEIIRRSLTVKPSQKVPIVCDSKMYSVSDKDLDKKERNEDSESSSRSSETDESDDSSEDIPFAPIQNINWGEFSKCVSSSSEESHDDSKLPANAIFVEQELHEQEEGTEDVAEYFSL